MSYDPQRHKRQSIRLRGYQYDTAGGYSVTVCTREKQRLFGQINDGIMELNETGLLVAEEWLALAVRFPSISLDCFVVMPNHLHAIVFLSADKAVPTSSFPALGTVIGAFKSLSARAVGNHLGDSSCRLWQRNYYEQIVRSDSMLTALQHYTNDNPRHWHADTENNFPLL